MSNEKKNDLLNDPRLTAYALGELSPEETKEIEMLLEKNKDAKNEVEDIKSAVNTVKADLNEHEKDQDLSFTQDELAKIEKLTEENLSITDKITKNWMQKFLYWGGPAIAATVLVVLNVNKQELKTPEQMVQDKVFSQTEPSKTAPKTDGKEGLATTSKPALKVADMEAADMVADEAMAPAPATKGAGGSAGLGNMIQGRVSMAKKSKAKRGRRALESKRVAMPMGAPSVVAPTKPWLHFGGPTDQGINNESYDKIQNKGFTFVKDQPLSTFSIDVDTASYSNMRRFLNQGSLPPADSIRIEELVNYFDYQYKNESQKHPIGIHMEQAISPWNKKHHLVKVGMKASEIAKGERPSSNYVFLLDVSGSMGDPNKLPLLKNAMKLLTRKLTEKDRLAIVVYAGASGVVLPSTNGLEKAKILQALTRLNAGGGTNGEAGIKSAYKIAKENFIKGGNNRIILATDGDFNVGTTNRESLIDLVKERAKEDIFLTVLGLGMGNYKDSMLEQITDKGNGNYAYLDTLNEAKKVLITDMDKTLHTVAKDVKIQVEFNPKQVAAYRLVGYENRMLAAKDFNDDKKDAGEVGAGHTVTAFYEVVPHGVSLEGQGTIDALKYQKPAKKEESKAGKFEGEFMNVKVRYKTPTGTKSTKFEKPLVVQKQSFEKTSDDFRFAASVASFGMVLRKDQLVGDMNIRKIIETAKGAKGKDSHGYRQEFIENVELARDIYKNQNQ